MFVYFQISFHPYRQIDTRMFSDLVEHMVEEAETGGNLRPSMSVQIHFYKNIRFLCRTSDSAPAFSGKKIFRDPVPIVCNQDGRNSRILREQLSRLDVIRTKPYPFCP